MGPRRDWRGYQCGIPYDLSALAASMGPRRDWRGYNLLLRGSPQGECASMGPRRDWRGYSELLFPQGLELVELQWGHAVIGVDTMPWRTRPCLLHRRFNGATP